MLVSALSTCYDQTAALQEHNDELMLQLADTVDDLRHLEEEGEQEIRDLQEQLHQMQIVYAVLGFVCFIFVHLSAGNSWRYCRDSYDGRSQ